MRIGYFVAYYLLISFHLELYESSRVALDGLADVPLDAVELHGPHHPVLLGRDADQQQPVLRRVRPVVDYLNTRRKKWECVKIFYWSEV